MKTNYPEKSISANDLKFNNRFGRYLISNFNTWHGGVHIEGYKKIQAIGKGSIIAYRFTRDYKFEEKIITKVSTKEENTNSTTQNCKEGYNYSNCFILVQHDIELQKEVIENKNTENQTTTSEKKYVTFYSLYSHLMPLNDLKNVIPPPFASKKTMVAKEMHIMGGLEVYPIINGNKRDKENKVLLADGTIFTLATVEVENLPLSVNNIPNRDKPYWRISGYDALGNILKDADGKEIKDETGNAKNNLYVFSKLNYIEKLAKNTYRVKGVTDKTGIKAVKDRKHKKDTWLKGAWVREKKDPKSKLLKIIVANETIKVDEEEVDEKWYKIKDEEAYVLKSNTVQKLIFDQSKIKIAETHKEKENKDKIIACDIPVKAGELIGYTGNFQHGGDANYTTCQVDVFMADEKATKDFLQDGFSAGTEADRKYIKVPKGIAIKKDIEIAVDLKKGKKVKVLNTNPPYVQVRITPKSIVGVVKLTAINWMKKKKDPDGNYRTYYHVKQGYFDEVNKAFGNELPKDGNVDLFWESVARVHKDGSPIGKNDSIARTVEDKFALSDKNYVRYRKLRFTEKKEEHKEDEFWIPIKHVDEMAVEETVLERVRKAKSVASTPKIVDYVTKRENRFEYIDIETTYIKYLLPNDGELVTKNPSVIIEEKDLQKTIKSAKIVYTHLIDHGITYTIKPQHFDTVNEAFNNQLLSKDALLHYVSNSTTKTDLVKGVYTKRKGIIYRQKEHDKTLNKKEKKQFKECRPVTTGDTATLLANVTKGYLAVPDSNKHIDETLDKEAITNFKINEAKDITLKEGDKATTYRRLDFTHVKGNTKNEKQGGWVDVNDIKNLKPFSVYNWQEFGFKYLEAGNEYMYDIQHVLDKATTESRFIKLLWDAIDETQDGIITEKELDYAYRTLETQLSVSKMVCNHKIEWSYIFEELKSEMEAFFDYSISINDASLETKLKEAKEDKLKSLKEKVTNLAFWNDLRGVNATYKPKVTTKEKNTTATSNANGLDFRSGIPENEPIESSKNTMATSQITTTTKEEVKPPGRIFPDVEKVQHFHPIQFINHMKLIFWEGQTSEVCYAELRVKAFMSMIRECEGTSKEIGYQTLFSHKLFSDYNKDMSTHPDEPITAGGYTSRAAGAYQILKTTYDGLQTNAKTNGIKGFDERAQDELCLLILKYNYRSERGKKFFYTDDGVEKISRRKYKGLKGDIIQLIIDNDINYALFVSCLCWASLPNAPYGQPVKTLTQVKEMYSDYLIREMKGNTILHLEPGFLNKFGYDCCSDNSSMPPLGWR